MKKFYERDLEDLIFNASSKELLDKGLEGFYGKRFRQLNLGSYGILDLLVVQKIMSDITFDQYLNINIYELKEDKIGASAFFQALRYARGIQLYMGKRKPDMKFIINIILIGGDIDTSCNLCFLPDLMTRTNCTAEFGLLDSVCLYTYDYGFNGITFDLKQGYICKQ